MSEQQTFGELRARLDEIVVEVRDKDLSLEKSLDLYEEAIKLGNRCAELVDKPDYTDEEAARAAEALAGSAPAVSLSGAAQPVQEEGAGAAEGGTPAARELDAAEAGGDSLQ